MKALTLLIACPLLALAPQASAQEVNHGLWEFKSRMNIPGMGDMSAQMAQMQSQLDQLPPETRAMLQEQMAASGVALGPGGTIRLCIRPEDAKSEALFSGQTEGECSYHDVVRTATTLKGRVSCTNPQAQGEFETRFSGRRAFSSQMKMTSADGNITTTTEARWIAADCGALRR